MKPSFIPLSSLVCLTCGTLVLPASGGNDDALVTPATPESRWTYGASLGLRFNLKASFAGLGTWNSPNPLLPPGPGLNRNYDDGYNRVDATGNAGGLTSFWGIANLAQFGQQGPGTVSMNHHQGLANGGASEDDTGLHPGVNLSARYEVGPLGDIGDIGIPALAKARWGWNFGLSLESIEVRNGQNARSGYARTTDTFASGPVFVGVAPYNGPFTPAPGDPLIPDTPTRTQSSFPTGAVISGNREIDAVLFGFDVGPWLEIPLNDKCRLELDAGLSLAIAHGTYKFDSLTTIPGVGAQASSASNSKTTLLPGVYVGLGVTVDISDGWQAYSGLRYQYLSSLDINAGGSRSELSFDGSMLLHIGCRYAF